MKTTKDIPYGISDFRSLILKKKYYVDRTNYIEKLENQSNSFIFFLRPRRFGKSLLISMLNYYYGVQYKDEFETLFGNLYTGKNPTGLRNSYYVMNFDFSGINTAKIEDVLSEFNHKVKNGLKDFNEKYNFLSREDYEIVIDNPYPSTCFQNYILEISSKIDKKILVLIDEYDHFTNEILSFHTKFFSEIVSMSGFVRKFYESIKLFTGRGLIDRFFATGVTPVTLDSMTSGFNIATNISGEAEFNEMAGFTHSEVSKMIYDLFPGIDKSKAEIILKDAEIWYNGSLFSLDAKIKLYNPAMLLRFIANIDQVNYNYPREMIDKNIVSDFSKIRNIAYLGNPEDNFNAITTILETGGYAAQLKQMFNFELNLSKEDFISLLYYNGLLTIKEQLDFDTLFEIPNYVIKEVYWEFFRNVLNERFHVGDQTEEIKTAVRAMANNNDMKPLSKVIEKIMKILSNRDLNRFDEKYIKLVTISYVSHTNSFLIKSEQEVNKKYPDLMFLHKNQYRPKYQQLLEIKYLKKEHAAILEKTRESAINQVKGYMKLQELKSITSLKYWLVIFVGDSCSVCCEVTE